MDEYWDLYDENRKPLGKTHKRGLPIKNGEYHLVVDIWTINNDGKILITQRHPNKVFGGLWECTGGAVTAGENNELGALRELQEEIGINAESNQLTLIHSIKLEDRFVYTYILKKDIHINNLILQEEEVIDAKLVSIDEIEQLCYEKLLVPSIIERWKMYSDKIILYTR